MTVIDVLDRFHLELKHAERKFPTFPTDPIHAAAIVVEEAGELQQAALQFTYENRDIDRVKDEAVQVGAMALRFLLNVGAMRSRPSEQVDRVSGIAQHAPVQNDCGSGGSGS
jgi:hypothetical protein